MSSINQKEQKMHKEILETIRTFTKLTEKNLNYYTRRLPGMEKHITELEKKPKTPNDWPGGIIAVGLNHFQQGNVLQFILNRVDDARPHYYRASECYYIAYREECEANPNKVDKIPDYCIVPLILTGAYTKAKEILTEKINLEKAQISKEKIDMEKYRQHIQWGPACFRSHAEYYVALREWENAEQSFNDCINGWMEFNPSNSDFISYIKKDEPNLIILGHMNKDRKSLERAIKHYRHVLSKPYDYALNEMLYAIALIELENISKKPK
jgi:tetratricopeptide (TPR) repeat protein